MGKNRGSTKGGGMNGLLRMQAIKGVLYVEYVKKKSFKMH